MAEKKTTKASAPEIAAKGGRARADALPSERKLEIATQAARTRWRDKPIKAEYVGVLKLGAAEIPCANLPDGRRVLSESAILSALGRTYSGYYSQRDATAGTNTVESLHRAVAPKSLGPFIPAALAKMLEEPIAYTSPGNHVVSKGIPAEALPLICDTWMAARSAGVLSPVQMKTATTAEIIVRGLASTGIVALVDEATGAQYHRARFALAKFLEDFVTKELAAWEKTFEDDFYKELFRLRNWPVAKFEKRPGIVGKWTTDIVYKRLAPGVLQRLQELMPRNKEGKPKAKLFQALTKDKGYIALKEHLASVTTIMKLADDWQWFQAKLDKVHPMYEAQLLLPFMTVKADKGNDEQE